MKRDGVAKAYGSRLAGSSTVAWLLRGPEKASARFAGEAEMEDLEDVLGGDDGSALIDWDAKVVRWQMANCHLPLQQQLTSRMIQQAFPGWDVKMHRDLFELTEYVGIDSAPYFEVEAAGGDDGEEEEQEEDEEETLLDEECFWEPPDVPRPIRSLDEFGEAGCWVTVRYQDGSMVNHFGFGDLSNLLLQGERFAELLRQSPTTERLPEELVTLDGIWIDWQEKTLWRWHREGVAAAERRLATAWDGWTLKEFSEDGWRGQVEVTGREVGDQSCSEREILAATVREYTPYDHNVGEPTLENLVTHARRGCISFTALVGIVALCLFWFVESKWMAVTVGVLFAICLLVTTRFIAMSSRMINRLDLNESPEDRNATMDEILVGLDYPTIDQLKASGELVVDPEDEEDSEDGTESSENDVEK